MLIEIKSKKIIGFHGIESYEIMHYLSRILFHMGCKVLLVDLSETCSLTGTVPIPNGLKYKEQVIDYKGVDFSLSTSSINNKEYNVVLVYFGFLFDPDIFRICDVIFYVTDQQHHNVKRLNKLHASINRYLIIKDYIPCKIRSEFIKNTLTKLSIPNEKCIILPYDKKDKLSMIQNGWNNTIQFNQVSNKMRELLFTILILILEINEKAVIKACKKAEKGR